MTDEQSAEMTEDIAAAWVNGKMLRKTLAADRARVVVKDESGRVIADFMSVLTERGNHVEATGGAFSFLGRTPSDKLLRDAGFEVAQPCAYNEITREIEVRLKPRREMSEATKAKLAEARLRRVSI